MGRKSWSAWELGLEDGRTKICPCSVVTDVSECAEEGTVARAAPTARGLSSAGVKQATNSGLTDAAGSSGVRAGGVRGLVFGWVGRELSRAARGSGAWRLVES